MSWGKLPFAALQLAALATAACGAQGGTDYAAECLGDYGPDVGSAGFPGYDEHSADRAAPTCKFDEGSTTSDSIGSGVPHPPNDFHVVLVMLENRSFDHYLSGVVGSEYATTDSNPDPDPANPSGAVQQCHESDFCLESPPHEWGPAHLQYDNGHLDGFVATGGKKAMAYYDAADLPFVHWLADNFAIGDHYFSSLLGPTWPNRLFFFDAQTCGYTEGGETNPGIIACGLTSTSLFSLLDHAHRTHAVYDSSGVASVTVGLGMTAIPKTFEDFKAAALANTLPDFSMVGASTGQLAAMGLPGNPENDDHPAADVRRGELFVYDVLAALLANPDTFNKTVLFITYDENGGFYDHMKPPPACEPYAGDVRTDYKFDRYGFRVPLFVVSAYTPARYVSRYVTDHTSITRFVENWLALPAMTKRDANAWPLLDYFDFTKPPRKITLPPRPPDPGPCGASACGN